MNWRYPIQKSFDFLVAKDWAAYTDSEPRGNPDEQGLAVSSADRGWAEGETNAVKGADADYRVLRWYEDLVDLFERNGKTSFYSSRTMEFLRQHLEIIVR